MKRVPTLLRRLQRPGSAEVPSCDAASEDVVAQTVQQLLRHGLVVVRGSEHPVEQLVEVGEALQRHLRSRNLLVRVDGPVRISNRRNCGGTIDKRDPIVGYLAANHRWHHDGTFSRTQTLISGLAVEEAQRHSATELLRTAVSQRFLARTTRYLERIKLAHVQRAHQGLECDEQVTKRPVVLHDPLTGARSFCIGSHVSRLDRRGPLLARLVLFGLLLGGRKQRLVWSAGDLLIWNNSLYMHRAVGGGVEDAARTVFRITIVAIEPS